MAWTNAQKKCLAMTSREKGIDRKLLLRQLPNAFFDREGKPIPTSGGPTSTSKRLTNADYDRVVTWLGRNIDPLKRMRFRALQLAGELESMHRDDGTTLLAPNGVGLQGWINQRIIRGRGPSKTIDQLDGRELYELIESLKAYKTRHVQGAQQPLMETAQ